MAKNTVKYKSVNVAFSLILILSLIVTASRCGLNFVLDIVFYYEPVTTLSTEALNTEELRLLIISVLEYLHLAYIILPILLVLVYILRLISVKSPMALESKIIGAAIYSILNYAVIFIFLMMLGTSSLQAILISDLFIFAEIIILFVITLFVESLFRKKKKKA